MNYEDFLILCLEKIGYALLTLFVLATFSGLIFIILKILSILLGVINEN